MSTCELCERENVDTTVHHLLPKEMGGTFGLTANIYVSPVINKFMPFTQMKKLQRV